MNLSCGAAAFGQFALEFQDAELDDEPARAEVLDLTETLVRDEFKPCLDEWLALDPQDDPDAPRTPFDLPEFENDNVAVAGEPELEAPRKSMMPGTREQ